MKNVYRVVLEEDSKGNLYVKESLVFDKKNSTRDCKEWNRVNIKTMSKKLNIGCKA